VKKRNSSLCPEGSGVKIEVKGGIVLVLVVVVLVVLYAVDVDVVTSDQMGLLELSPLR